MKLAERIAQLRELAEGSQKKPWYVDKDTSLFDGPVVRSDGFFVAEFGVHDFAAFDAELTAAMRNAIGPLIQVVEQQREALEGLLLRYNALVNSGDCGNWNPEIDDDVIAARAALALMDKED